MRPARSSPNKRPAHKHGGPAKPGHGGGRKPGKQRAAAAGPGKGAGKGSGKGQRKAGRGGAKHARPFKKGDLRLVLLSMIAPAPTHGYELIKSMEERLGGGYTPSPGVIYPTLSLLEDLGLIAGSADGTKKLYGITSAGSAHLAEQEAAMPRIEARMNAFGAATNGTRAAPVLEAMETLRLALRDRATAGVLTDEQIAKIRTVLTDSAAKIEQV